MANRILMSPPDVGELEQDYVLAALRSGWVAPAGPDLVAFEEEVAARVGVRYAVGLASGTAGLHLAQLVLGVQRDDVVIVPTMTFAATANAVTYVGARPCFVDASRSDGNIEAEAVAEAITALRAEGKRVAAVMPVDLLGRVCNYPRLLEVCRAADVPLIEDAAEALGASISGKAAGSFGEAAVVSFNGNKIMTTSGGGMLLTDNQRVADRVRFLSTQAREPVTHYEHKVVGYNYRLSNILAALGRAQLARLDSMIERRRAIRDQYRRVVDSLDGVDIFQGTNDQDDNFWLTSLMIDPKRSGFTAGELAAHLEASDIECRPLWKPMHMQPVFADAISFGGEDAQWLFENGVTLPSGSVHDIETIDRVAEQIAAFAGRNAP